MSLVKPPIKINLSNLNIKDLSLLNNSKVNQVVEKCNNEYQYWDKVKQHDTNNTIIKLNNRKFGFSAGIKLIRDFNN